MSSNKHALGREGERIAATLLERAGFTSVRRLNDEQVNFPFADLYAERAGRKFFISVKARNRYEKPRRTDTSLRENSRFRLGGARTCRALAERVRARCPQAEMAWVIIRCEEAVCDAYFGTLAQIDGLCRKPPATAILTAPKYLAQYECLCKDHPHGLDYSRITNRL